MKKFFANGKEVSKVKGNDKDWLTEMSSKPVKAGITELDVGDMADYPTLLEKIAVMTLKSAVRPEEPVILKIDEEHEIFKIKRHINGYVVSEAYCCARPGEYFGPYEVKKACDAKVISIQYYHAIYCEKVTCTINWTDYPEPLTITINDDLLKTVLEKRSQFEVYVDTIKPQKNSYVTIFKQLSKLLGSKRIQVFSGTSPYVEKVNGIWGSLYGDEKIERVCDIYKNYTLEYEYGNITYKSADGIVKFTNPEKDFGKFELTLTDKQISNKLESLVKKATSKATAFYEKVKL